MNGQTSRRRSALSRMAARRRWRHDSPGARTGRSSRGWGSGH